MKAARGPLLSYGDGEKLKRCFVLKRVLPGVAPQDSFYIITDESSQKLSPAKNERPIRFGTRNPRIVVGRKRKRIHVGGKRMRGKKKMGKIEFFLSSSFFLV